MCARVRPCASVVVSPLDKLGSCGRWGCKPGIPLVKIPVLTLTFVCRLFNCVVFIGLTGRASALFVLAAVPMLSKCACLCLFACA